MRLFALMVKDRLLEEVGGRISDLSEAQLDGWLKGHISLADEVLARYGQTILENKELAASVLDLVTMQEVRDRLVCSRPDLADRWGSPEFERAFGREVRRFRDYIGVPESPLLDLPPCEGK
jgi:hypothetical protein